VGLLEQLVTIELINPEEETTTIAPADFKKNSLRVNFIYIFHC